MKKTLLLTILVSGLWFLVSSSAYANNLTIDNVEIVSKDKANKTSTIQFDISWENSWRGSRNYDAVWVFVKYKLNSDGKWYHANLKTAGTNPSGFDRGTGTEIDIIVPSDKVGAFIQRSNTGAGTTSVTDVELVWDWDAGGLDADAVIDEIKVFGIEMTYIPSGNFYVGDTQADYGQFEAGITGAVFQITSEGALTLGGGGAGSLGNNNATGMATADDFNDSTSTNLPSTFPKGYDAFYCMKYEISQGQYRDFLNTLTRDQQNKRTFTDVSTDAITNIYVMANNSSMEYRNGIKCPATGNGTTEPITFGCDYNEASTFDESTDGEWIACNYLSWMDGCAYADWAGLRPMTELEFEKVCRGPETSLADECAWGTTDVTQAEGDVQSPGEKYETAMTTGNGLANYDGAGTDILGPLRIGFAAASATNRVS
ncbi:MAG: SUMF1/EgtB/PvdO family nonheme iron enzyme, partial [Candidatus Omnitrophica bacterium]|nr:SUMF1/EgtB/PvdO family nonheme iron enzyme [Candidatus Omnitrophota bacterium]